MKSNVKWAVAVVAILSLTAAACADPQEISEIKSKLSEIQAQQKDILTKLDGLSAGQKQIAKAGPARPAAQRPTEDPNKVYDLKIGDSPVRGPADAPVTIVEFSDFQCPFCAQAHGLIEQVLKAYPKEVKFVYKNYPLPFHPNAMPAAKAAVAAGMQGKFYEMHDKIFANQRSLNEDFYIKAAGEIGLNVDKFKKDMASPEVQAEINTDMKEAQAAAVRGTPTIFINGKKPQGRSFDLYKNIIDGILKEKKAS